MADTMDDERNDQAAAVAELVHRLRRCLRTIETPIQGLQSVRTLAARLAYPELGRLLREDLEQIKASATELAAIAAAALDDAGS